MLHAQQGVGVFRGPALRGRRPETPPLERVAGNVNPPPVFPGKQAPEVHGQGRPVGPGHGADEGVRPFRFGTVEGGTQQALQYQRGIGNSGARWPVQRHQGAEDGVRAQFNDRVNTQVGGQGLHALPELHRLAGVPTPVRAVHSEVDAQGLPRYVADQRHGRRRDLHAVEYGLQVVQGRFHQRAVIGGTGPQPPQVDPLRFQPVGQGMYLLLRPADNLVRAVVHADAKVRTGMLFFPVFYLLGNPAHRGKDGGHGPGPGQVSHQAAAGRRKLHTLFQGEHSGGLGSGNLSQAVAQHRHGFNAHAAPQGGQGAFQGIDGRLRPPGLVQVALGAGPAEHHVQQGHAPLLSNEAVAAVHYLAKHGFLPVESLAHSHPLVALSGIDKGNPGCPGEESGIGGIRYRFQSLPQCNSIAKYNAVTKVKMAARHAGGPDQVGKLRVSPVLVQPGQVGPGRVPQGVGRLAGQGQETGRPPFQRILALGRARFVLIDECANGYHASGGQRNVAVSG